MRNTICNGQVNRPNQFITYNLNIEQFAHDIVLSAESAKLVLEMWNALQSIRILDPTCGSGAFLFAALNVLEPIYTACIEAAWQLCTNPNQPVDAEESEAIKALAQVLKDIEAHRNQRYFVMKTIIIKNLYGVDIMEGAVEICRLRLFLKLAAQLTDTSEIEPLPDIDFNILTGNTLVGFDTLGELTKSLERDIVGETVLPKILHKAREVEAAYEKFCDLQSRATASYSGITRVKDVLKTQKGELRVVLDKYTLGEVGKRKVEGREYEARRNTVKPFHWLAEHFGIMNKGGFDVVIGNPPYVNRRNIEYTARLFESHQYKDIYAHVVERSLSLVSQRGYCGMILPLSLMFSRNYAKLRRSIMDWGACWMSSYSKSPSRLFEGANFRNAIWLGAGAINGVYTTQLHSWRAGYRKHLLDNVSYSMVERMNFEERGIPKLGSIAQAKLCKELECQRDRSRQHHMVVERSRHKLMYSMTAYNYISAFDKEPPSFSADKLKEMEATQVGKIYLNTSSSVAAALALTAGEIFYWHWLCWGDEFHVLGDLIKRFIDCIAPDEASQSYEWITQLGKSLSERSDCWLKYQKNAGRWVGSFDYRPAFGITRRAELIAFSDIGWRLSEILEVYSFVQMRIAMEEESRQRDVRSEVASKFHKNKDARSPQGFGEEHLHNDIDTWIQDKYKLSPQELKNILTNR